jgi:hypothetical protein
VPQQKYREDDAIERRATVHCERVACMSPSVSERERQFEEQLHRGDSDEGAESASFA